jgi:hypothetical protein
MITEINDGEEEGGTPESEDVEMLVRCEVRYPMWSMDGV